MSVEKSYWVISDNRQSTLDDKLSLLGIDASAFKDGNGTAKAALLKKALKTVARKIHPDKAANNYHLYKISDLTQLNLNEINDKAFILVGSNDAQNKSKTVYFVENHNFVMYEGEKLTITLELPEGQSNNEIIAKVATVKFQFLMNIYDELAKDINKDQREELEKAARKYKEEIEAILREWKEEIEAISREWKQNLEEIEKRQKEKEQKWQEHLEKQKQEIEERRKKLEKCLTLEELYQYQDYKARCWHNHKWESERQLYEEYDPKIKHATNVIIISLMLFFVGVTLFIAAGFAIYRYILKTELEEKKQATEEAWLADSRNYLSEEEWLAKKTISQEPAKGQTEASPTDNMSTASYTSWQKTPEPAKPAVSADKELPSSKQSLNLNTHL